MSVQARLSAAKLVALKNVVTKAKAIVLLSFMAFLLHSLPPLMDGEIGALAAIRIQAKAPHPWSRPAGAELSSGSEKRRPQPRIEMGGTSTARRHFHKVVATES